MNVPVDISDVRLKTDRLILRPWQQSDLDDFFRYASVDGVGQMAGWQPHSSPDETLKILNLFIAHKKTFALEYQGKVIGSLGIEEYDEDAIPDFADLRCRELGFVLSREYWGLGLMPEAVNAVIRWLFTEQKLDVIVCGYFAWNRQSARVQQKCGFRKYGEGVYHTHYGTTETEIRNVLYRVNWQEAQK